LEQGSEFWGFGMVDVCVQSGEKHDRPAEIVDVHFDAGGVGSFGGGWRSWLEHNHTSTRGVWLCSWRTGTPADHDAPTPT
jgi:hypothetical protein